MNFKSNTKVAEIMNLYDVGVQEAQRMVEFGQTCYDLGRKDGNAETQRFFRLILGLEVPSLVESAYWNNPVPLKDQTDE